MIRRYLVQSKHLFKYNSYYSTTNKMGDLKDTKKSRIGMIQICSLNNKETNFQKCKNLIDKMLMKEGKVDLICLPENFAFIGGGNYQMESRDNAEFIDQPDGIISRYQKIAKDNRVWLSLGGFHEKIKNNPEMIRNCHLIIDSDGTVVSQYHKMHLFDVDIPSKGVKMTESKVVERGNDIVVVPNTPVGTLGLSVCYDVRFPELYVSLVLKGAQVILVPAAFMKATGQAHWKPLLQARAIETQCYVVAAAQCGQHHAKRESYGHSLMINPWGEILQELPDQEDYAICEIDHDLISTVRQNIPVQQHRQPSNYLK
ncbi:nitrilase 1 [Tieghemostelium lacteum]|uniref:Nitrilase 1 n=1 Tax=Tieghemostelium lacteum TaxID=361077 RepID=A0A152A783_TIELA|nr:nitrilase 1 [Tieghemostelium lacteum]|eukprot:KYR02090.1 nitrilase 1 [Tieghemostelium lacteum]